MSTSTKDLLNMAANHDDVVKHYSTVTRLVHYTSKFLNPDDGKSSRNPSASRRFRLAPLWPEWNDADVNAESWDVGLTRRKEASGQKTRTDPKISTQPSSHLFDDPDGKIELPSCFKIDHWKRPSDFIHSDKPIVVVDNEFGVHSFDLIASNTHLHQTELFRHIISQINALWDICRRERKTFETKIDSQTFERTWRPWEHIYALNKVTRSPFIPPYNATGKYVVRLYFLGSWRKIIIDDTIPFDDKNRCLLPQTTLNHELWPMLLSKALLKIIFLEFNASNPKIEYNETTVLHSLTGWIPEPIPLKYGHAEKIWNFLRYDRSNRMISENQLQNSISFGPIPLFQWAENKTDENSSNSERDSQNLSDDKSSKKIASATILNIPKVTATIKPQLSREKKSNVNQSIVVNPSTTVLSTVSKPKETKKGLAFARTNSMDDGSSLNDDQNHPDAPKLIVFGTISTLQPDRFSSFGEKADRSERLRQYNINETFSTSMLLTKIRDIPLEPPAAVESVPAWKLIRPRKPFVIPSAEPIAREKSKSDRWIEITSPYINYPTASVLNITPTTRPPSIESQITFVNPPFPGVIPPSTRSRTPMSQIKTTNIIEIDEDDENKGRKLKARLSSDAPRSNTSLELNTPRRELSDVQSKVDESSSAGPMKLKREMSIDKSKMNPRASILLSRMPSDFGSVKSKVKTSKPIYVAPKIWMNFDDFCACFTSIIVFHNPRGYQHSHKFTDVKFVPYQQPIVVPPIKEKKKDNNQNNVQIIPNLQEDKSILYLFVDTTRETREKNIELIVSLSCLSRWFDSTINENLLPTIHEKSTRGSSVTAEKNSVDVHLSKTIVSQKDVLPQAGLLICEICSWKSLSLGQPILRLHSTSTKAAPIVLKPGRHVLKFTNTCPLAFHLHVMSDTHDFTLGDEEQLLNKIASVPEDRNFIDRAEELFIALDQSVDNFHRIPPEENALTKLFLSFCENSSSNEITLEKCQNAFQQSLYPMIRTMMINSGTPANIDIQYAWRCFTNDLQTPDILHCYRGRRSSNDKSMWFFTRSSRNFSFRFEGLATASRHSARSATISSSNPAGISSPTKRALANRDRSLDEKNLPRHTTVSVLSTTISEVPNESSNQWTSDKIEELKNIQRIARGFLQRRVLLARTVGTEKNLIIQRFLQNTMSILKSDPLKSSLLLFHSFISNFPLLIQCFPFANDDWNMVTYHDYHGIYQEPAANNWFIIFRDVFYVHDDCFLAAKFLSHLPNSLLRIINNDNYTEMPLVFNRVAPGVLTKNKFGYTFVAQGVSTEPSPTQNRYRLRLLTAYVDLPEPRADPLVSSFYTRDFIDYYLPNKEEIICRFRVRISSDLHLTGRSFHLTSIQFVTSNTNVLFRLSIFDQNEEILGVDGKGTAVLPAVLFFSGTKSSSTSNVLSRPSSNRTGSSGRKREGSTTRRGSASDSQEKSSTRSSSGKKSRSTSRTESFVFDDEEKFHKYFIQVKLLRQSWPLNSNQIEFAEQIKEQEKNEFRVFNRQIPTPKTDENLSEKRSTQFPAGRSSPTVKTRGNLSNLGTGRVGTPSSRPSTGKSSIDMTKPHWTLRIVSDADKVEEITVTKDNERNEELMNMKKAWETVEAGRAQKAFENRQKFLETLQTKNETTVENVLQPFLKPKLIDGQAKTIDSIFEQEEFERRQIQFMNFAEFNDGLREKRREDLQNRYEEKLRQLSECIELQGKVDETRRSMFEPREAFRQRFLEIERKRLAALAAEEQKLLDQTMKPVGNKRNPSGKKTKKNIV